MKLVEPVRQDLGCYLHCRSFAEAKKNRIAEHQHEVVILVEYPHLALAKEKDLKVGSEELLDQEQVILLPGVAGLRLAQE